MPTDGLPIWGRQAGRVLRLDCRHYLGDRPCAAGVQGVCPAECEHASPMGHRIVIIKLGALGDVIRTAALLPGLKQRWPQSHLTWVTRPNGVRMLANHPLIDRLLPFDAETVCHLEYERFDLCINLDKEAGPAALAMRIDASERLGIGLSPHGTVYPLNRECADYFRLGLDDALKFHSNEKSYPQLVYEALGLAYAGQRYRLYPAASQRERAARFWQSRALREDEPLIGLNTGAGNVFANKNWSVEQFVELARTMRSRCRIALFGGPDERRANASIAAEVPGVIDSGSDNDELTFAALVERCDVLVTGDTMAMHVGIALEVPCVVLFGPTCSQEIDLFGRGEKLITSLPCSPCYLRSCDKQPNCMEDIRISRVVEAVERWLGSPKIAPQSDRATALPLAEAGR